MVKVSVVVPIYNVQRYLRQCLDSILGQTLSDIEIICVNDGSTDTSLEIINEYVARDPRFKVIDKKNSGYGHSMNMGFDMAQGEYIAIIESDDYAEPNMLEVLYSHAKKHNLDTCKGGFYYYYSVPEEKHVPCCVGSPSIRNRVVCQGAEYKSSLGFKSLKEKIEFFGIKPTIWSAIYRNGFIKENIIRFTETAGASFQDTAFNFKVWALAERIMLIDDCLLHYRQDNEASSVNSGAKVFSVCDEFKEIERFLDEKELSKGDLFVVKSVLKYDAYIWNYERLNSERAREFILPAAQELKHDLSKGGFPKGALPWYKRKRLGSILENPLVYHEGRQRDKEKEVPVNEAYEQGGVLKRWTKKLKKHGVIYTVKSFFRRLK